MTLTTYTKNIRRGRGPLLVLLLSCGLAAWWPLYVRRENAQLKEKLLHQRQRTRALRLHLDTLQAQAQRPAPPPSISL